MADLIPRPATAGFDLPVTHGDATLGAAPDAPMLSIMPFRGREEALAGALGAGLPDVGRTAALDDGSRLIWAGLDLWLLRGPRATPELAARLASGAAVTDQSDGWTALTLTGGAAADVLARLVPIDLDPAAFPAGAAARTELRHMMCLLVARADGFEVLMMRSFTDTAVHDIKIVMRAVAARSRLAGPGLTPRNQPL